MNCPTDDFRRDHEAILDRWNYPAAVRAELTATREKWISSFMKEACCKQTISDVGDRDESNA